MERNQRHALLDIVLLVVCAVASGANGWEAIEEFGCEKRDGLRKFAPFANGVPSHDCIANVVSRLTPKGFGECFRSWTQAVAEANGGQVIAQGGDDVLGLKGNQSALQERVEDFFAVAASEDFSAVRHDFHQEIDKDHGRLEVRRYWVTDDLSTLPDNPLWAGLRRIGMVERHCTIGTTETVERRNSIPAQATRFASAVRGHWGVENRLHWRLDVIFGDDASRIRKGNAPAIMTTIRHLGLNLFEQDPSKLRLSQKRRKAAWNDDDRAKVVFGQ